LFPKIVRNAALIDSGDPVSDALEIGVDIVRSKRDSKRVARMGTSAQFATMYLPLKYDNPVRGKCIPVDRTRPPYTEPLSRYGVPILEAGITNVAQGYATVLCEALSDPMRIGSGLLDPQVVVFAVATEFDSAAFNDDKIAWMQSNRCREQARAMRASPPGNMLQRDAQLATSDAGTTR